MSECTLPFPRDKTACDGVVTASDTLYDHILGRIYEIEDFVHGTGEKVGLRAVKNDTGASITVARKFMKYAANALDWGRKIGGVASAAGSVAKPLYDGYTVGAAIVDDDVLWVVEYGPCYVLTELSSVSLAAGDAVATDASGYVNGAVAASGEAVLGTMDAASTTTNTSVVIHVRRDVHDSDA